MAKVFISSDRTNIQPTNLEQNEWKIPPDTTVQVVEPFGIHKRGLDRPRNWSSIWISLIIIGVVLGLIALAASLLIPLQSPPFKGRRLCLSDLSDPDLIAEPSGFQWISDEEIAYVSEFDGILSLNMKSKNISQLLNKRTIFQTLTREFEIAPNRRYILLTHDIVQGRLFTRTAQYSIYDVEKTLYFPLKLNDENVEHPSFQLVQWIVGNCSSKYRGMDSYDEGGELVLVYENNVYYMPSPRGLPVNLTDSGKKGLIFNGVPDIVYEEILQKRSSVWTNPCGTLLAYISYNDTNVLELPILEYPNDSFPTVRHLRYATVNSPIPELVIWIYDLNLLRMNKPKKWSLKLPFTTTNNYLLGVGWSTNSQMWISSISRDQSTTRLSTCSAPMWNCEMIYSNYQHKGISPLIRHVVWTGSWAAFLWPENPDQKSWHNQVVLVGVRGGKPPPLSVEKYNVKEILASTFDQTIYFLGSKLSDDTSEPQLYRLSRRDGTVSCLSCMLSCKYVNAELNQALTYAAIKCKHLSHPSVHLVSLRNPHEHFDLHTQPALRKTLGDIALPIYMYEKIDLSSDIQASVSLKLPPDWKKDDDTFLFPLIVQTVGIENLNLEDDALRIGWSELLPSGHHVAHAKIRLSGNDHLKSSSEAVAYQMSKVIQYILDKYPFLDKRQVFGWGWGSGASVALQLSSSEFSTFKCIALINPVYDWKYYASFWSERLLGSVDIQDGRLNYEESHLLQYIEALNVSHILLVQSTGDPLSHHSVKIIESLLRLNLHFTHVVYPDRSLVLQRETHHLLRTLLDFFLRPECVKNFYRSEDQNECKSSIDTGKKSD